MNRERFDIQIAIVGAGPGGLTLARLLQLNSYDVKVYERDTDPSARVQGSPLDMHEGSGWTALERCGLINEFLKNVRIGADKKIIVNKEGEVVFSDHEKIFFSNYETELSLTSTDLPPAEPPKHVQAGEPTASRPEIDRGALRKVLLDSLQPGTVNWNSHFIGMDRQGAGWLLQFKNGTSAYADFVVGADGANSKIRPLVTDIKPFYTGVTMLEINIDHAHTTAPRIHQMMKGGKIMAFGDEHCILGGQKSEGGLGFYAAFKPAENWPINSKIDFSNKSEVMAWFKQEFNTWSESWYELIENATPPFIPRSIYCMPPDQKWASLPNLTLLGDAAHVMPPFAGEGANTSMFDAVELTECLLSPNPRSVPEAINAYESKMRKRASAAANQSLQNGEMMFSKGALEKMLSIFT